jgi:hypothetical protein
MGLVGMGTRWVGSPMGRPTPNPLGWVGHFDDPTMADPTNFEGKFCRVTHGWVRVNPLN